MNLFATRGACAFLIALFPVASELRNEGSNNPVPHGGPVSCAGPFVAKHPGELPHAGSTDVAGVKLPPGRPTAEGAVWISIEPTSDAGELWAQLAEQFSATGLWPMLLGEGFDESRQGSPPPDESADAEGILRRWWDAAITEAGDEATGLVAPLGTTFPGLAPAQSYCALDILTSPRELTPELRLALVPATRPADAAARLGWNRVPHSTAVESDEIVTVLRSWEDRFGAYPSAIIGRGFLELMIERPPQSDADQLLWAAELFAMYPDSLLFADLNDRVEQADFWWVWLG